MLLERNILGQLSIDFVWKYFIIILFRHTLKYVTRDLDKNTQENKTFVSNSSSIIYLFRGRFPLYLGYSTLFKVSRDCKIICQTFLNQKKKRAYSTPACQRKCCSLCTFPVVILISLSYSTHPFRSLSQANNTNSVKWPGQSSKEKVENESTMEI